MGMSEPFRAAAVRLLHGCCYPKSLLQLSGHFALTLSGDITRDGHLRLNLRVLVTFTAAVSLSLSGGCIRH